MNAEVLSTGALDLVFTSQFQLRYNDQGSGATMDGAFWQPIPPAGFNAVGGVAVTGYQDINGNSWAICVKASSNSADALAYPTDYQLIWDDKGSHAHMDGSCWRAIPPYGYVALGDIFVTGYNKPSLSDMICVRNDLTCRGMLGSEIYADHHSGASMDIDVYQVNPPTGTSARSVFGANTYVANNCYQPPSGSAELNCFSLPYLQNVPVTFQDRLFSVNSRVAQ